MRRKAIMERSSDIDMRSKVAFVILSCDRYRDLWGPCIQQLYRYWQSLPFQVYLTANRIRCDDPRVITLLSGDDPDWSTSFRLALQQLNHPFVFLWFDDAFIDSPVDSSTILRHLTWAIEHDTDYLRLRGAPRPNRRVAENIGRLYEGMPYRTTCFSAIWKRTTLLALLSDGESAADFEMRGTIRSYRYPSFYGVYRSPLSYIHGVIKGTWLRSSFHRLKAMGATLEQGRAVMTKVEEARWRVDQLKSLAIARLPPGWANFIFEKKRKLLRTLRLRRP
jgi:hypothetical protein